MNTLTRRRFLLASGVTAAGALAAGATTVTLHDLLARARTDPLPQGTGVLVLLTLYGGNDGLATVVPYADPAYAANRPGMAYAPEEVLHLDAAVGLNPALTGLKKLWDAGRLAVVQGVGYPQPDHSHFRSMAIWQTASPQTSTSSGWLGRWLDRAAAQDGADPLRAVSLGPVLPPALAGDTTAAAALPVGAFPTLPADVDAALATMSHEYDGEPSLMQAAARSGADLLTVSRTLSPVLDGAGGTSTAGKQTAGTSTPGKQTAGKQTGEDDALSAQLDVVARCIRAGVPTRVYGVSLGGFDTHSDEKQTQSALLGRVDAALTRFLDQIRDSPRGSGVCVLAYSEFGRRVAANASEGTDHGTAGPVLVLGPGVRGGLVGERPSLTDLDDGDLKYSTDFRSVYATVLDRVLDTDPAPVLGGDFPGLPLLSA